MTERCCKVNETPKGEDKMETKDTVNPYYLKGMQGDYYNKYPEFQVWEEGRQVGIKEVVKWLKENSHLEKCNPDVEAYFYDFRWIDEFVWQSKLKEWGTR